MLILLLPHSRNREHCFIDFGALKRFLRGKLYVIFICRKIVAVFDIFVKDLFQSPNFDQTNFNTGFVNSFKQNLYCYLGQIRDISIL